MDQLPLFVFGTLRRGQCNHCLLQGRYVRMLPAQLPGFTCTQPLMIARRDGALVDGELYFLRDSDYERTLADCDLLEGIPPGTTAGEYYRRLPVTVLTSERDWLAWAYVHPQTEAPPR